MRANWLNPDTPYSELAYSRQDFEKLKYGQEFRVSLHDARLERQADVFANQMVYRLQAYIWANPRHASIEYPKDWVEWLRDRWFPKWAKRRWPIKMTRVDIREIFPEMNLSMPAGESRLTVAFTDE